MLYILHEFFNDTVLIYYLNKFKILKMMIGLGGEKRKKGILAQQLCFGNGGRQVPS